MLRNPHFDYGLSSDAETSCLFVKRVNYPLREVYVDPFLVLVRTSGFRDIQKVGNVLTFFKCSFEFIRLCAKNIYALFVDILSYRVLSASLRRVSFHIMLLYCQYA